MKLTITLGRMVRSPYYCIRERVSSALAARITPVSCPFIGVRVPDEGVLNINQQVEGQQGRLQVSPQGGRHGT